MGADEEELTGADGSETDECAVVLGIAVGVDADRCGIGVPSSHLDLFSACASSLALPCGVVAKAASIRARHVSEWFRSLSWGRF